MEQTISSNPQLRLRVFAGPNGSGKSTVIKSIEETIVKGRPLYLGTYINADDIAVAITQQTFYFSDYDIHSTKQEVLSFAIESGLLIGEFDLQTVNACFDVDDNKIILAEEYYCERLAQLVARFLRAKLLAEKRRFSFETVFSHESNLDIMRKAADQGYKVYLYFVSTEDPEINKYRVALRVKKNGHNVPEDKIESRYYRSLQLARQASDIAYQAFFFDNSIDNEPYRLVGHFKKSGDEKVWAETSSTQTALWFTKYCR